MTGNEEADDRGLYCSTAGTYFTNKGALADHYKSEFHRYFDRHFDRSLLLCPNSTHTVNILFLCGCEGCCCHHS